MMSAYRLVREAAQLISYACSAVWVNSSADGCSGSLLGRDRRARIARNRLCGIPEICLNLSINPVLLRRNQVLFLNQQTTATAIIEKVGPLQERRYRRSAISGQPQQNLQRFSVWLTHTHDDRILSPPRGYSIDHMCMQYGAGQFLRKPL